MEKLRFGMIGGGEGSFIGDVHRRGAELDDLAVLTAGCFSRTDDKNRKTAQNWHIDETRLYSDFEDMAKRESARKDGIDFVVIATPNNTHFPIAKCFLEQGIHVSCDKPVAMKTEEAEILRDLAAQKNLRFGVSYTYVNYPMVHQMRAMIEDGKIGHILTVMAEYPQDWVIRAAHNGEHPERTWRFDSNASGVSASTADIGTHLECLIHHGTGLVVKKVLANLTPIPAYMPLETNTQVLCQLSGGIPASIWASQVAFGHECSVSLRVFGDKGALEWCHDNPNRLKYTPADEPEQYLTPARSFIVDDVRHMSRIVAGHPEGFFEAFATYYHAFCLDILHSRGLSNRASYAYPAIEDGIRGLQFVDACIQSNQSQNSWVSLR